MKKLISIFGALTITATTTVMVVSCANLDNYNEIKSALDNKDSMIILISAEDCTHCETFSRQVKKYNDLNKGNSTKLEYSSFDDMITSITKYSYNERASIGYDEDEAKLSGFGDKVDKVTFKEYKSEHYKDLFNEEWLVSLKDLIRGQLRETYSFHYGNDKKLTDDQMNSKINANYLDSIMTGTPTFLHFRHGRFIGTSEWTFDDLATDVGDFKTGIETYVRDTLVGKPNENGVLWGDAALSATMYNKISGNDSSPETGTEE